jgi:hypothetical protein
MKLLNSVAMVTAMFLAHLTSAGTIGQRETETLYRGVSFCLPLSDHRFHYEFEVYSLRTSRANIPKTCNTGTMLCTFQRDETMGDSCMCASVAPV